MSLNTYTLVFAENKNSQVGGFLNLVIFKSTRKKEVLLKEDLTPERSPPQPRPVTKGRKGV